LAKHEPASVDLVELDPELSRAALRWRLIDTIPGLNVIHQDGRAYLSSTDKQYDAIIVNLPEPATFQVNRFFTEQFFRLAKAHIRSGGVLSFAMEGYENYLAEPQRQKLSSVFATVKQVFGHVLLLPGEVVYFLASDAPLRVDIPDLLDAKGINTDYAGPYYSGTITPSRMDYLRELMDPDAPANADMSPRLMRIMFSQWFAKYTTSPRWFFGIIGGLGLLYLVRLRYEEVVLFTTGASMMGCEILVIFAFQIFYGYIYHQIGIIVTVFLVGLLPGAWLGDRLKQHGRTVLIIGDAVLMLLIAAIIALFFVGGGSFAKIALTVLCLAVSLVCGCQFPVVLYLRGDDDPAVTRSFSADLMGAACGVLTVSVVLIPVAGLVWTGVSLIAVKLISLVMVAAMPGARR
jgi:spermidine synthase